MRGASKSTRGVQAQAMGRGRGAVRLPLTNTAVSSSSTGGGKAARASGGAQQRQQPQQHQQRQQPTLTRLSPVLGLSVQATQPAKRQPPPGYKGTSQFYLDRHADTSRGLAPATGGSSSSSSSVDGAGASYRVINRPARQALPRSPLHQALPRTLEAGTGRDLFYEQAKSPLHSDSSPIVISSLCYSSRTQDQSARAAAARSKDLAGTGGGGGGLGGAGTDGRSSAAGETSVKALFKAYHKPAESAIHRRAVIAQAKARSARRQQRVSQWPGERERTRGSAGAGVGNKNSNSGTLHTRAALSWG